MSEIQPGTPRRAEPGPHSDGPVPQPAARAEPNLHPEHGSGAGSSSAVPPVPPFAAQPEVPRFAPGPDVPRFGNAMPHDAPRPDVPRFGDAMAKDAPGAPGANPPGDDRQPPFPDDEPLRPFIAGADPEPTLAQRWGRRLALATVGLVTLGTMAAGLMWYNGQRKVDRQLEALAMHARAPAAAEAVVSAPPATQPDLPPAALPPAAMTQAPPAPVQQPAAPAMPPPVQQAAPTMPAPVQQAATPSAQPPMVMLPPEQAQPPQPAPAATEPARPAAKTAAKGGKKATKAAAKKNSKAKSTRAGARKGAAAKPKRRCKRGQLVRECLGLPE